MHDSDTLSFRPNKYTEDLDSDARVLCFFRPIEKQQQNILLKHAGSVGPGIIVFTHNVRSGHWTSQFKVVRPNHTDSGCGSASAQQCFLDTFNVTAFVKQDSGGMSSTNIRCISLSHLKLSLKPSATLQISRQAVKTRTINQQTQQQNNHSLYSLSANHHGPGPSNHTCAH